jgi:hypothetical protein
MQPLPHDTNPFIARFLARLPRELAASFSPEQLEAVQCVFGMRYAMEHAIDMRRTLRLPWGRYYIVLLAGRDRRGPAPRLGTSLAALMVLLAGITALFV